MTFAHAVYSKFRYAAVLYPFRNKVIMAPLYSFSGRGVASKSDEDQTEMMEIFHHDDSDDAPRGKTGNKVLKVKMIRGKNLEKGSCVWLAAAFSVDYHVDMDKVGELEPASKIDLLKTMEGIVAKSRREGY